MKKIVILLIGFLLFVNIVSASYNCSTGSMNEAQKEIAINGKSSINGLGIGLTYSDETAATGKYSVKLITDAIKFELNNETNSTEVEMKSGTDTITLLNVTLTKIRIKVDGDSEEVEIQETTSINDRKLFLISAEGVFPGDATLEGIIGNEEIPLDNTSPTKIITINSTYYLLELFSASDNNAIIIVKKCYNKNASIVETADAIVENTTIINATVEATTPTSNETDLLENETSTNENLNQEILESKNKMSTLNKRITIILICLVMGGIFLSILLLRNRVNKEQVIGLQQSQI